MADQIRLSDPLMVGGSQNGTNGHYPPVIGDGSSDGVSLHEIMEVLFKNKWLILICFISVLSTVAFYTFQQSPEYEASSTVYINTGQSSPQLGDFLGVNTADRNISNEIELVRSRRVAERVAEALIDIEKVPGTDQAFAVLENDGEITNSLLKVTRRLQNSIRVEPVSRGVDIIRLTATSTIPQEAALISTFYAQQYKEYNRLQSRSRTTAAREFLRGVTDSYDQELQQTEEDLTAFLNRESVVAPDEEARQLLGQVSLLQQTRNQARIELAQTQAELRALETQVNQIMPGLATELSSGDNIVVEQLVKQIADLDLLIETKYARNPGLKENPSQDDELQRNLQARESLKSELDQRTKNLVEGGSLGEAGLSTLSRLRQEIMQKRVLTNSLETRVESLNGQLGQAQGQLGDIPRKEVILSRLQRDRQTTEQLYIALEEKLQEALIAEQSEQGFVDIVDEAIVPGSPVRPRVRMNLALGAVLGLLLGVGLAFIRSIVDNKVRKPEDLRKRGHQVIGVVPNMEKVINQDFNGQERVVVEGHEYSTRLISLLNPLSPIAESYRRLRTNIQFSRPDKEVRTLLVTSASPSEGKTVTAINLAITMAQAGRRTLYIDADLRRPQGHRMMGVPREPGLVDVLFDALPDNVEQFATALDTYLYIVPAGRDVPNPSEVLGSRKMKNLLNRWKSEFDTIIIDTPPALVVADALITAAYCDTAMLIAAAGETNWQAVDRSIEAMQSVGADIMGVMLNRFDAKMAYGGYKYGYGYGYEYGYGNYYYGQNAAGKRDKRQYLKKS